MQKLVCDTFAKGATRSVQPLECADECRGHVWERVARERAGEVETGSMIMYKYLPKLAR